jgi:hypothetical protein
MAINKNHEFEELNGVKCAIVEKNASQERVDFLKALLELNKFTVVVAASAPPKAAALTPAPAPAPVAEGTEAPPPPTPTPPPPPTTFTIGVTDVSFNPINAIFGRLLKTKEGHVVTLGYWQQKETTSNDEVPYYADPALVRK